MLPSPTVKFVRRLLPDATSKSRGNQCTGGAKGSWTPKDGAGDDGVGGIKVDARTSDSRNLYGNWSNPSPGKKFGALGGLYN